jgi:hypothetical protein
LLSVHRSACTAFTLNPFLHKALIDQKMFLTIPPQRPVKNQNRLSQIYGNTTSPDPFSTWPLFSMTLLSNLYQTSIQLALHKKPRQTRRARERSAPPCAPLRIGTLLVLGHSSLRANYLGRFLSSGIFLFVLLLTNWHLHVAATSVPTIAPSHDMVIDSPTSKKTYSTSSDSL